MSEEPAKPSLVMPGPDPGIHVYPLSCTTWMAGPWPRRSGFGRAGGTSPAMTMWWERARLLALNASSMRRGQDTAPRRSFIVMAMLVVAGADAQCQYFKPGGANKTAGLPRL